MQRVLKARMFGSKGHDTNDLIHARLTFHFDRACYSPAWFVQTDTTWENFETILSFFLFALFQFFPPLLQAEASLEQYSCKKQNPTLTVG